MDFLHTMQTGQVVPRQEGLEAAERIFRRFQDIAYAELLARLSLRLTSGKPGDFLSDADRYELVRDKFINKKHDSLAEALTIRGIVAVNMVTAETLEDDLAFELREPFREMEVLDLVYILYKKQMADRLTQAAR